MLDWSKSPKILILMGKGLMKLITLSTGDYAIRGPLDISVIKRIARKL